MFHNNSLSIALMFVTGLAAQAQPQDRGVRGGPPAAGQPIAGLTPGELDYFANHGAPEFNTVETVADGLGPRFNLDSCGGCHAHPAVGGSSPPTNNPQVVRGPLMAPGNTIPAFLEPNGPVREVRFKKNPDGTPDGGVYAIFTIAGRSDKPAGQRAFFLHDGRTSDLLQAILAHSSQGSEANKVIDNFQSNLSPSQQQDVLNFLRSL